MCYAYMCVSELSICIDRVDHAQQEKDYSQPYANMVMQENGC